MPDANGIRNLMFISAKGYDEESHEMSQQQERGIARSMSFKVLINNSMLILKGGSKVYGSNKNRCFYKDTSK